MVAAVGAPAPQRAALVAEAVPGLVVLVVQRVAVGAGALAGEGVLPLAAVRVVAAAPAGLAVLVPALAAEKAEFLPGRQAALPN